MAGTAPIAPSCAVQLVESKSIAGTIGARPARAPPLFRRTSGPEGRFPGGQPPPIRGRLPARSPPSRFDRVTSHGRPKPPVRRHAPCYTGPPCRRPFVPFSGQRTYDRKQQVQGDLGRRTRRLAGALLGPGYVRRGRDVVHTGKNAAAVARLIVAVCHVVQNALRPGVASLAVAS